jgi:predicted RND superfamily exporter protein
MKKPFYARYALLIAGISVFLLPFAVIGALRAKQANRNDVKNWIPAEYEETQVYRGFREKFQGEEFILVSWDGCTINDEKLELLARKMMPPIEVTLADGRKFIAHDLTKAHQVLADEEGEFRFENPFFGHWQLGADGAEHMPFWEKPEDAGDPNRPDETTAAGEMVRTHHALFKSVLTGRRVLDQMTSPPLRLEEEEAVERLNGSLFGPDRGDGEIENRQTCLVTSMTEAALKDKHLAVRELKRLAIDECAIPADHLHMGGPPVDNVAIDHAGQKSLNTLAGIAVLIGSIVSWISLRNLPLVGIVISAGIYSAILSLSIVWWTGAPVDAILFTMPSLVYVATTSGAIHLTNYYRDVRAAGAPAEGAAGKALRHAALPLSLATGTTAVGLLTLCYTELVPIRVFGFYSAVGVVVSAALLVFYVPAALEIWKPKLSVKPGAHSEEAPLHKLIQGSGFWWQRGEWVVRNHAWIATACLLVMFVVGYGLIYDETSVQLMRLLSPKERIIADYEFLERELGPLVPMEIVVSLPRDEEVAGLNFLDRMRLIGAIEASVREIDEVGSTMSTVTFSRDLEVPLAEDGSGAAAGRLIGLGNPGIRDSVLNKRLVRHRDEYLEGDYLREQTRLVDGEEVVEDLWRISARVSALKNVDYAAFIGDLKAKVEPVLEEARAEGAENLGVVYTGVVPLVYKAQHSLMDGLVIGFLTDFALIVIVMMIACRDWSAGMVLLLPSAFPAVVVFGGMGWIHHTLTERSWGELFIDIGFVMAPCVALGVTVDDVVHYLLWFRKGIQAGLTRAQATMLAYRGCSRAMYQSWGVIGIGMAVFALSPFMPTRNFGIMMISLLTVALAGNLLLMPAILAGPGGAIFAWGIRRKQERAEVRRQRRERIRVHDQGLEPQPVGAGHDSMPHPHLHSHPTRGSYGH